MKRLASACSALAHISTAELNLSGLSFLRSQDLLHLASGDPEEAACSLQELLCASECAGLRGARGVVGRSMVVAVASVSNG